MMSIGKDLLVLTTAAPAATFRPLVAEVEAPDLAVSIIVPAHNEKPYIGACLSSLFAQTLDPATFEVIVIDDGSTDGTIGEITKFPQVRLLTQRHGGPANARNLGATKARGSILAFLDADMTFAPDFVEKLIGPILAGSVIGTFSTDEFVANPDNLWARSWNVCYYLPQGRRVPDGAVDEEGTVFRAIAREPFFRVGGFDSTGYHDDHTVSAKLGIMAVRVPGAVCYHANPATLREVFASAHWIGKSDKQLFTLKEILRRSPPGALKRGIARVIEEHEPFYPIYEQVYSAGILSGMIRRRLLRGGHAR